MSGGNKLRKDPGDYNSSGSSRRGASPGRESPFEPSTRPLRILASGAIFITHTLGVDLFPEENSNTRAQSVSRLRGGAAAATLSVLAQFSDTTPWLVAPIGSGPEGAALRIELEREGIITRLCPKRETDGVPKAFVIRSNRTGTQTVINHNPIPDVAHDEFFRIVGPLLYSTLTNGAETPKYNQPPPSPAIDWFHFEGRNPHATAENLQGLDGWLREREWRHRVVLSVEIGRPGRLGQEMLIQLADVIFFSKAYAMSQSHTNPRSFLLSLRQSVPPHTLLVCSWGKEGAAILSLPTREYFQSSPFVPDPAEEPIDPSGVASVRSSTAAYGAWASQTGHWSGGTEESEEFWSEERRRKWAADVASPGTSSTPSSSHEEEEDLDEADAEDVFTAGMIFALSRRILPGSPYSPYQPPLAPSRSNANRNLSPLDIPSNNNQNQPLYEGRWRLDECLRFATEMAGRRMRRRDSAGLALAMEKVGWRM